MFVAADAAAIVAAAAGLCSVVYAFRMYVVCERVLFFVSFLCIVFPNWFVRFLLCIGASVTLDFIHSKYLLR